MMLSEKIIKGITEIEYEINPELLKDRPWPKPELYPAAATKSTQITDGPKGEERFRYTFKWPNGSFVEAIESHSPTGAQINLWSPTSNIPEGSWNKAIKSIVDNWKFPAGFYVYVDDYDRGVGGEIDDVMYSGDVHVSIGYAIIPDQEPGDDDVVDHFQGYEGEPASKQKSPHPGELDDEPEFGDGSASLTSWTKAEITARTWAEVMAPSQEITAYNPLMIFVKYIDNGMTDEENKRFIGKTLELVNLDSFWVFSKSPGAKAWNVWPGVNQSEDKFDDEVSFVVSEIDKSVKDYLASEENEDDEKEAEPKAVFLLWLDHPKWLGPVSHGGEFSTVEDAIKSAKEWHAIMKNAKTEVDKTKYSWQVVDQSGNLKARSGSA